jgi:hypothetical protein
MQTVKCTGHSSLSSHCHSRLSIYKTDLALLNPGQQFKAAESRVTGTPKETDLILLNARLVLGSWAPSVLCSSHSAKCIGQLCSYWFPASCKL